MHKCIVCGNRSNYTRFSRTRVIYHGIPKDAYIRRKWLNVFGIDRCYDWQRVCSDHFLEENYKPGIKRFLLSNAIPQPYDRNAFLSKVENIENAVVNNFKSSRQPTKCLTRNNEDMSNKNMPVRSLRPGLLCSIKNCFNRLSKTVSLFGYPKDLTLRKKWMEKCGLIKDPAKIVISSTRVCRIHFELDCFKNTESKNRLNPRAVPSLFLDNALPMSIKEVPVLSTCENQFISPIENEAAEQSLSEKNNLKALPMSINEVPVLSTCEDQFVSPIENEAAEQSLSDKNNLKDNTDNTSMIIDLTIDDSSNSLWSNTLKPIEKRKNCNAEDFSRDEDGIIFKLSKEVVLPSVYWKSEHLNSQNATKFYEQDTNDEIVKIVYFDNNLVPSIEIYGKKYEYTTLIKTEKEIF
ncbi:uncharacterized protein LOC100573191 [Acyrthosiphon pisum]|uniref:THAP-type domain-containing protein n=1 Tax=Acyrthosiphon pisum TaxID=7029 RepID=A0A8R2D7B7_ACYPI|nr:uncharacterized protein LOC100573191 [Acyrthosiphon pisum]|eukprot:XP_016664040.1 PREDICTED: uncharacterized protein LOC100573191 [Acyrthosiphon pisum]